MALSRSDLFLYDMTYLFFLFSPPFLLLASLPSPSPVRLISLPLDLSTITVVPNLASIVMYNPSRSVQRVCACPSGGKPQPTYLHESRPLVGSRIVLQYYPWIVPNASACVRAYPYLYVSVARFDSMTSWRFVCLLGPRVQPLERLYVKQPGESRAGPGKHLRTLNQLVAFELGRRKSAKWYGGTLPG